MSQFRMSHDCHRRPRRDWDSKSRDLVSESCQVLEISGIGLLTSARSASRAMSQQADTLITLRCNSHETTIRMKIDQIGRLGIRAFIKFTLKVTNVQQQHGGPW